MGRGKSTPFSELDEAFRVLRKASRALEWKALTITVNIIALALVCAAAAVLYFLNFKNSGIAEEYIILIAICLAYCVLGTVLNIIRTAFGKKHSGLSSIFYILAILVLLGGLVSGKLYLYFYICKNADIVNEIPLLALSVYSGVELFGISLLLSVLCTREGTGTYDVIEYIFWIIISAVTALIIYFLSGWINSMNTTGTIINMFLYANLCAYLILLTVYEIISVPIFKAISG